MMRRRGGFATSIDISRSVRQQWAQIDDIVAANSQRVIQAFRLSGLSTLDLMGTTGYGYDDRGRTILDRIAAEIFGCEAALIRSQWVSGTHALATVLMALARPGRTVWVLTGAPYDSIGPTFARLIERGCRVRVEGTGNEIPRIGQADILRSDDVVYLQRSRGYSGRRAWGAAEIRRAAEWAHQGGAVVVVDNCYGEFTQVAEPGHWGADLVAGSLMKNPGGSIAPTGAYVSGREDLIRQVAEELYAPGIGGEVGASAPYLRLIAQGLFLAPQLVGEALKGGVYISHAAQDRGIPSDPDARETERNDIVVALDLGAPERVVRFCQTIQAWEPVDAHVKPEPWVMPGYDHPVIMAAGGFVSGGSLELSADAPIRPPYRVFVQGGVNRWHTKLAVDHALDSLSNL
ncbi:MAG: methionine gamma-lyase family protein [Thermaerobacter sp.]|nr:methionine gamma-lyase family protein [Thermaerobacter sp.]